MDLETRRQKQEGTVGRGEIDALVRVRRALELAEGGKPLYPGEDRETERVIADLEGRLARLRALGDEFAEVGLSEYVRHLVPGQRRMTLAS